MPGKIKPKNTVTSLGTFQMGTTRLFVKPPNKNGRILTRTYHRGSPCRQTVTYDLGRTLYALYEEYGIAYNLPSIRLSTADEPMATGS